MDDGEIDRVLVAQLVDAASDDLELIASDLAGLYEAWRSAGAADASIDWLHSLVVRIGWWSGRLGAEADPELLERFPRFGL